MPTRRAALGALLAATTALPVRAQAPAPRLRRTADPDVVFPEAGQRPCVAQVRQIRLG